MKTPQTSAGRHIRLSIIFYMTLWLAEAVTKVLAVLGEYTGDDLKSTLTTRLGEGIRVLAPSVFTYIATLLTVYALFAILNAHYATLLGNRIAERWPRAAHSSQVIAFFVVNISFLVGVYGLNAAVYPASNLAFIRDPLGGASGAGALRAAALTLLAVYLAGFIFLNLRHARKRARAASLAVWAVLIIAPLDPAYLAQQIIPDAETAKNDLPNVIMIGLDSLNPRHTGYAGYPLPLTPNLDAFLKENIVFGQCYTPIARTFPSWYSILTGQYPVTNGVRLNLQKRKYIRSSDRCLGHVLRKNGYTTVHFTDEVRFSNITAAEGFDVLRHPVMGVKDFVFGSFHDFSLTNVFFNNPLGGWIFPFLRYNRAVFHLYDGRYFINDLITSLDRLKGKGPFFLATHLCIGHWPYFHASPRDFKDQPGADPRMKLYDSAISMADAQLGRIIRALKKNGLYDDAIIVVLSDHGESADGHGSDLRDSEQNRTVLAWKPAGKPVHKEFGILVRTIDIAPTVLDLLNIPAEGRGFDGVTLGPWIRGSDVPGLDLVDDRTVFMETEFSLFTPGGVGLALQSLIEQGIAFYEYDRTGLVTVRDEYFDTLIRRRNRALLTPDWKLVRDVVIRGGEEKIRFSLFNLRTDPGCKRDVSTDKPNQFKDLWDRMSRYYGSELAPAHSSTAGNRE